MIIMVDVTPLAVGGASSWTYDGTAVNGTSNVKITNGPSLVDVTELGDNFVNRFPTIRDWSMNFDMVYDATDAGQAKLIVDLYTPAKKTVIFTIGGGHTLTGSVYIESVNYSFDPKEVVRASVSMKGDSLLVYA
jgi:hypothetical protein